MCWQHPGRVASSVLASFCEGARSLRLLETDGWGLVSTEGSHRQFKHPTKPGRVTVSGSLGDDMPKGTLAPVKRQAGFKVPKS